MLANYPSEVRPEAERLRDVIALQERRQAERREHAEKLAACIDNADVELDNLRARLEASQASQATPNDVAAVAWSRNLRAL